jgi:hypothetical protein
VNFQPQPLRALPEGDDFGFGEVSHDGCLSHYLLITQHSLYPRTERVDETIH